MDSRSTTCIIEDINKWAIALCSGVATSGGEAGASGICPYIEKRGKDREGK